MNTEWMRGSVGVGVHWTPLNGVADGEDISFAEAVERFDVDRFIADLVGAGARHIIFTTAHALQILPMPNAALDRIASGRTCRRDLFGEILDACHRHGIRVVAYYNHSCNDDWSETNKWRAICGCPCNGGPGDMETFAGNICSIVAEMSGRYGTRIDGWWFDSPYSVDSHGPHVCCKGEWTFPFDRLMAAARTGNPEVPIAINGGVGVHFQYASGTDFCAGEAVALDEAFSPEPDPMLVDTRWICADDPGWVYSAKRGFLPLRFPKAALRDYVREHVAAGRMVTFNVLIDRKGFFSPVLRELRAVFSTEGER